MSNIKQIERIKTLAIAIIVAAWLLLMTSCIIERDDICGTITGGYSEYNSYTRNYDYYFRLTSKKRARVDELTFYSYRVGDYICLDY